MEEADEGYCLLTWMLLSRACSILGPCICLPPAPAARSRAFKFSSQKIEHRQENGGRDRQGKQCISHLRKNRANLPSCYPATLPLNHLPAICLFDLAVLDLILSCLCPEPDSTTDLILLPPPKKKGLSNPESGNIVPAPAHGTGC